MKLKYYLRGLGVGVIVTTIVLSITLNAKPAALTDAQIKERAKELGMVEKDLIKDKDENDVAKQEATEAPEPTKMPDAAETTTEAPKETTAATETTATKETTTKAAETAKPETTQPSSVYTKEEREDGTYVTIEVGAKDWSNHVADKLKAAGLIENAEDFDNYLINNGYETIIASGTHVFKVGSSYEELAKELIKHK